MSVQMRVKKCSIRVPKAYQDRFSGRMVVRLSLNPLLYDRTRSLVRWRTHDTGRIRSIDLIYDAISMFPENNISHAVEARLVDLLCESHARSFDVLPPDELEHMERFQRLTLYQKIRATQKRNRTAQYLKKLSWETHGRRRRV